MKENELTLVRDQLVAEMKRHFENDPKRINHALSVLSYAEKIIKKETGDPLIVMAAAILHDVGIKEAKKRHGSSAGIHQEKYGPPVAEKIMKKYQLNDQAIDSVKKIIANHHSAKDIDTPEFRIVWDADWIVNIPDEFENVDKKELGGRIDKIFRTKTGKEKAHELYTQENNKNR